MGCMVPILVVLLAYICLAPLIGAGLFVMVIVAVIMVALSK